MLIHNTQMHMCENFKVSNTNILGIIDINLLNIDVKEQIMLPIYMFVTLI